MSAPIDKRVSALQQLNKANPVAHAIFTYWADGNESADVSDVDKILNGIPNGYSRMQIIATLREIQRFGVGQFVAGRRGQPSRFEFQVTSSSVGQSALGIGELDDNIGSFVSHKRRRVANNSIPTHINELEFPLREGYTIRLELPDDLTPSEANRLSAFIMAVPFEAMNSGGSKISNAA